MHMQGAHDIKLHEFECLVQYRVNALDPIEFNGVSLTEILLTAPPSDQSVMELITHRTGATEPDAHRSLGEIVNIEAIYHPSFIALPYQWSVERSEVLSNRYEYARLLSQTPMRMVRAQTPAITTMTLRSERITYYATPTHAVYEVGGVSFWCEAWRRPSESDHTWSQLAIARECAGFDDRVQLWEPPAHLPLVDRVQDAGERHRTLNLPSEVRESLKRELDDLGLVPLATPPRA